MKARVLFLTQWFEPEPVLKGISFARELMQHGFDVEVVTGFPNYPQGKLYAGYKLRVLQREKIDDVSVTRVPLYPNHDDSAFKRIINYVSFGMSSFIYGLIGFKRPDVIYAYHPPLTTGLTAILLKFLRRAPVVLDIQDMWPDTLAATGMLNNKKLLKIVTKICSWIYKHADQIVVLSPGFKRLLIERGVREDKIQVIYNWCNEATLNAGGFYTCQEFFSKEHFNILFAGNLGYAQGLNAVLDAAEKLVLLRPEVRFIFLGAGSASEQISSIIFDKKLTNVVCLPPVAMNEVGAFLNAADVLLVHLKDDPLFSITIPSKTQAYMNIGKPILMAVRGDAADLIEAAECGVVAAPENMDSLIDAVIKFIELSEESRLLMGKKGREFYNQKLSLAVGVEQFSRIFEMLYAARNNKNLKRDIHKQQLNR